MVDLSIRSVCNIDEYMGSIRAHIEEYPGEKSDDIYVLLNHLLSMAIKWKYQFNRVENQMQEIAEYRQALRDVANATHDTNSAAHNIAVRALLKWEKDGDNA